MRVITNRSREGDGGDFAGEELIAWLRSAPDRKLNICKCLLFCNQVGKVPHVLSPGRTFVTANVKVLSRFCDSKVDWKRLDQEVKTEVAEAQPPKVCKSCGKQFLVSENTEGACKHHAGQFHAVFQDCNAMCAIRLGVKRDIGVQHWSCCFLRHDSPCTVKQKHVA